VLSPGIDMPVIAIEIGRDNSHRTSLLARWMRRIQVIRCCPGSADDDFTGCSSMKLNRIWLPATVSKVLGPLRALVDGVPSARPVPWFPVATAIAIPPAGLTARA
jgi:hypothetical protein